MRAAPAWTLLPVAGFLAVFFLWPVAQVLLEAGTGRAAWQWLAGDYARGRILGGILQAFLSLGLAAAIAVPLAWLHHRWRIPGSRALLAVHAAAFVLPVFVVVGGLRQLLGRGGFLHEWTGVDLLGTIGPWGAVPLANATYNAGLLAMLVHAALERRPRLLEHAAATLGASPGRVMRRVTWPLLRPALLASLLLVLLFCLASFGVVLLLGEGRIDTLDTLLYATLRGAFPRTDRAAVLAVAQAALQGALLLGILWLERRSTSWPAQPGARTPRNLVATAAAWTAAASSALVPVAVLAGSLQVAGQWSLAGWRAVLGGPGHLVGFDLGAALVRSLGYAASAVLAAVLLTGLLAYAPRAWARWLEPVAFLPLGTSSVVLGFAFLAAFAGRTWLPLVGSPWGIVAAHTLLAFPFVARSLLPALRSIAPGLEGAAASLGAGLAQRIRRVHLPLLRRPLAVACGFAAALSLGDYGASLVLMTPDTMSLAVWIGRHGGPGAFDPLARAQSMVLSAILLLLTLAALAAAAWAATHRRPA